MNDNNSTEVKRGEIEVLCCRIFTPNMQWYYDIVADWDKIKIYTINSKATTEKQKMIANKSTK